jgi:hypothetical protein
MVDQVLYSEIHQLMQYSIKSEEGLTLFQLYEGKKMQEWYRILLRKGMTAKRQEFERERQRLMRGDD